MVVVTGTTALWNTKFIFGGFGFHRLMYAEAGDAVAESLVVRISFSANLLQLKTYPALDSRIQFCYYLCLNNCCNSLIKCNVSALLSRTLRSRG